mgnify:FL=1
MIQLNKKAKKIVLIAIPIIIILIIASIFIGKSNKKEAANEPKQEPLLQQQANVYLASTKDHTLVPLTIKFNQKDTVGENMLMVLSLIKENSAICNDTFQGLIPEEAKINQLSLDDQNVLTIDFDEGFFEYDEKNEVALLESITWTMTEFDEIEGISLTLNQEPILKMPRRQTPVASILTREMGINNLLVTSTPDILGSTRILSYYTKTIDKVDYIIPVTQYVQNEKELSIYDLTIEKLLEKPAITTRLKVVACLQDIELEASSTLDNQVLKVTLNEQALFDENSVQSDIYEVILASMNLYEEVENVSFVINDVDTPVSGLEDSESFSVQSIIFNEYYI